MRFSEVLVSLGDFIFSAPYMAVLGVISVIAAVLVVLFAMGQLLIRQIGSLRAILADRTLARDKTLDMRLMLTKSVGGRSRKASKYVAGALEAHLPRFIFGTPVRLVHIGRTRPDDWVRRRVRSDAEGILTVSSERSGKSDRLCLRGAARNGTGQADHLVDLGIEAGPVEWTEDLAPMLAYKVATLIQPALTHPEDFREDRVHELATALSEMLQGEGAVPLMLKLDLERDFCRCALHLAETGGDPAWLDRVIELRKAHVDATLPPPEEYLMDAQLDLGRALILKADGRFDAQALREGVMHLNNAIEGMRKNPAIKQAEAANAAIKRATQLMSARQRFSVTGGGV